MQDFFLFLIVFCAAGGFAVFLFLQRASIPNRAQRTVFAILVLSGSVAPQHLTPFGPTIFLFWIVLGLLAWAILLACWRKDQILRQWWSLLDLVGVGSYIASGLVSLGLLVSGSHSGRGLAFDLLAAYLTLAAGFHLLHEFHQANVLHRPAGLAFAEALIITGVVALAFHRLDTLSVSCTLLGASVLVIRLRSFLRVSEGHRILAKVAVQGEQLQPEYTPPSLECPEPKLWSMYDSMAAEKEVLDLLYALVRALKPKLAVETGTFSGLSSTYIARAMKGNGRGRLITCEMDPLVCDSARKRFHDEHLDSIIDCRLCSSFDLAVDEPIDFFYSDSDVNIREQEVRNFLAKLNPFGLILMHDASSRFKVVREGALKLEKEGLISVVFVSTPRGLVIAQKREGRK
jgi:predicted O-methyltransferase YrrM